MTPHPLEEIEIDLELNIRGEDARRVLEIAERRKQEPADMLLAVLHHAIADDMIDAIIDDGR